MQFVTGEPPKGLMQNAGRRRRDLLPARRVDHKPVDQKTRLAWRHCAVAIATNNLQKKLDDFTDFYNNHSVHTSPHGSVPTERGEKKLSRQANSADSSWRSFVAASFNYQFAMHNFG